MPRKTTIIETDYSCKVCGSNEFKVAAIGTEEGSKLIITDLRCTNCDESKYNDTLKEEVKDTL